MVTRDSEHAEFLLHHTVVGPLQDFPAKALLSPVASASGFPIAKGLLEKAGRNEVEDALVAALQLAGRATVLKRREEAFLLYVICIESLVAPSRSGEVFYRFSRSLPHLFETDIDGRKRIVQILRDLYNVFVNPEWALAHF